jgi:regulator of sigma E protease
MTWVLAILGFTVLIVGHEAGHFFAAKACGMRVERFFLFFPPKLVSIKRGETEYGIGAIPAGGFVKISGMNPEEELPPDVAPRGYYNQPVWKRIVVIGAGPAVNIVLAFLIFFVLAFGVRDINGTVGTIDKGSPAAASRLQPGDRVVAVDGHRYASLGLEDRLTRFGEQVASHECPGKQADGCRAKTPVKLTVSRDGSIRTLTITPRYDPAVKRTRIGFSYGSTPANLGVAGAAGRSLDFMWQISSKTVSVIGRIFEPEQRKQVSGIVGTAEVTHQAFDFGIREALTLIAVVSLSLGLINLFPFLPLDGGHIFWSLVEKVRGSPVPFSVMERAGALGFVLVIMLFAIGLTNDIGRLTGDGFNVR